MAGKLAAEAGIGLALSIPDFINLGKKTPTYGDDIQLMYDGSGADISQAQRDALSGRDRVSWTSSSMISSSISTVVCLVCILLMTSAVI